MRNVKMFGVALVLTAAAAGYAYADQPGADWMSADQIKQKLMESGYSSVTKIEADDGHWEGEGVKNGQKREFHVDPHSGAITKDGPDD
jgi:hypothetical protein